MKNRTMKNKEEIVKVLCDIEKEIKYAKKLSEIKEPTDNESIKFGFHISQILNLAQIIQDNVNKSNSEIINKSRDSELNEG